MDNLTILSTNYSSVLYIYNRATSDKNIMPMKITLLVSWRAGRPFDNIFVAKILLDGNCELVVSRYRVLERTPRLSRLEISRKITPTRLFIVTTHGMNNHTILPRLTSPRLASLRVFPLGESRRRFLIASERRCLARE